MNNKDHYAIVPIGHNLYISHKEACGRFSLENTLHIWREDHPHYSCDSVNKRENRGLVVNYKDGESLANADKTIEEIANFLKNNTPILIHCAAGQTRSPTIAIIGKLIRGATIAEAVGDIMQANWQVRGIPCNFCLTPMQDILQWCDRMRIR